ncbi:ABC transporter substrate-binding protein [uncultured Arcticibacterium sp.]|uniref:ABC transporter substrate-binding protein n=1 Tax=uncultured Arcticibacterium sp. TaxID=2173042 RepID=UPI0030F4C898
MRYLVIALLFMAQLTFAQRTDEEYLLEYKEAVQLYADEDFNGALQKLTPLSSKTYTNSVVPYALYYYALASLKENKAYQSRGALRDLFTRFPDWDKIEEAYYLYGVVNFEDKYYSEGIPYLERITSKTLEKDVNGLMQTNIPTIENVVLLKELNQKFPNQRIVAETLVNRIQARKYNTKADLELSDQLTNLFNLVPEDVKGQGSKGGVNYERAFDDHTIDFGVLLPFALKDFSLKEATGENRYVYDLFIGMKLAVEKLTKENVPVRLYGFDVDKTSESLEGYLKDKNFKKIDLIIGPLYGRPNKVAETYTTKNKIFQVHPISNSRSLISDEESRFLLQSSNETQAEKCLDFVETLDRQKSVSVYHDGSRKDSLLAHIYAETAKNRGYKVIEEKRFIDKESISANKNPGHVFITGDAKFGPKIIRALGQQKSDSTVIATDACFNMEVSTRDLLSKNLYLVYPQYIDGKKSVVKSFRRTYIDKMKMIPSYYAYLGYDMMLFYGRMLKDGKEIFRLNLDESPKMDDLLLSGFDYSNKSFENKVVPIVKYNRGRFEIVNSND